MAGVLKKTTGLVGLAVAQNPHENLRILYTRILTVLQSVPQDVAYRKYTEQIINERLNLVKSERNVQKLEDKINCGQIEEVISQPCPGPERGEQEAATGDHNPTRPSSAIRQMAENEDRNQKTEEQNIASEQEEHTSDHAIEIHEVSDEGHPEEPAVEVDDTKSAEYIVQLPSDNDAGTTSVSVATLIDEETVNKTSEEIISMESPEVIDPTDVVSDQSTMKPEDVTVRSDTLILDCSKCTTTESPTPIVSNEWPEEEPETEPAVTCEELRAKLQAQIAAIASVHGKIEPEKTETLVSKGTDATECLVYRSPPTAADRDLKKRSVLQAYPPLPKTPPPDIASSTVTVKVALLPTGDVMTVALPICLTTGKLKARFGKELKVPANKLEITCDSKIAKDSETLVDLGVRPHGSIQLELTSVDPEKHPIKLIRPQQESATSDVITVTIQKEDETCYCVVVEIERRPYHKPFLGGFRHKITGKEFHHAGTQTPIKKTNCSCVERFCRETQTVSAKNQYQQTTNNTSTQMTKIGCYVSNITDKLVTPGKYFTAAEYHAQRLKACADPIRWKAYDGRVTEMDTPFTIRARELRDIYNSINMKYLTRDERLDALLTLKHTVKEHDCKLTQEIVELIDREADLLMRQVKESYLEGLRQRISTLFLQYVKTPTFNPEIARFLKVPQDPMQLRKNIYFCSSCGSYLPSTEFPLSLTSQTLKICRQCFQLNNEARRREESTLYKTMLKRLRKTEANFEDGSRLAFLLQEQDLKHLVDSIWGTQSALSASNNLKDLTMIRWDKRFEWSPWNCILLTEEEAVAHLKLSNIEKDYEATFVRKIKHRHTLGKTYFSRIPEIVNYAHTCLMQDLTSMNDLVVTNSLHSKQKL
ncbi:hypothetical protein chiPu_0012956 [Chiloscyllium punctatum]|uniref:Ubiquitin-like domain-containing protein n=1 Tax=Chiloscyllium punctatum TaxID=137246 RepID=A0A401SVR2_CHIPU|nr:hypothetical protein [Chiloscyllium punctatum]